jgi:hypothetical protein
MFESGRWGCNKFEMKGRGMYVAGMSMVNCRCLHSKLVFGRLPRLPNQ